MQNNTALMILVVTMSSILIFNSGCNGSTPSQANFGSIAVPTSGKCGSLNTSGDISIVSNNTCYSGTLQDIADSTTEYLWNCVGANGGASAACNLTLPPQSVLPGTSNGLMDDSQYFYVGLDTSDGLIAHVHGSTGFAAPCGVDKASLSNEDITCIAEIPEGDLYMKDLSFIVNVPPGGMCRYLTRQPYWFYNYEVGKGPETIDVTADKIVNASGDHTTTNYTCSFDGGAAGACSADPEITAELTKDSQAFTCKYDKSEFGEPNCCFGKKTITTTTTTNGANPSTTIDKGTWGGGFATCIGGPGKTNWPAKSSEGVPIYLSTFTEETGTKERQRVSSPSTLGGLDTATASIHAANYYGDFADHTHTGFINSADSSTAPYFVAPIDDRSGSPIASTQPAYEFQCQDAAFEINHRIRVYVRDWDTMPDYLNYISSAGTVVVPDRGDDAEPGVNCIAIPAIGYDCNDVYDTDDFLTLILQDLGLTAGGFYDVSDVANRPYFFPKIEY